ncbi:MAG: succinate dehydrogenase, partial [Halobaculum sp.]
AAGDNEYLGPAAINKAYRFAMDEREGEDLKEHRLNIPLTEHIQELKREAVKNNLKFW